MSVVQQIIDIPMGMNYGYLLISVCLYSYGTKFIKELLKWGNKKHFISL